MESRQREDRPMGGGSRKPKRSEVRSVRTGRPPRALAGEVEARILDAARIVFLEHGLAGASMDEIAELAHAGKPTIYARFRDKKALFSAVVTLNIAAHVARFEAPAPAGASTEERLVSIGTTVLHWALGADTVGLIRLAIAEAHHFPDLASRFHRMGRERAAEAAARLLGEVAQSDEFETLPAFASERLVTTARFFLDLMLLPLLMRALLGEELKPLRAEITPHIARSVPVFLAACRHNGGNWSPA